MVQELHMDLGNGNDLLSGDLGRKWREALMLDERDLDDHKYKIVITGNMTGITESFTKAFAGPSVKTLNGYAFGEDFYGEDKYELTHTLGDVDCQNSQLRAFGNFSHKIGYLQTQRVRELDKQRQEVNQPKI